MGSRRQSFSTIGREAERDQRNPNRIDDWVNGTDSTVSGNAARSDVRSRAPPASTVYPHSSVSGSHGGSRAGYSAHHPGSHCHSHLHSHSHSQGPRTPSRSGLSSSFSSPISFSMANSPHRCGGRYPPPASSSYSQAMAAARTPASRAPTTPSRMSSITPSYASGPGLSRRSSVSGASRASGAPSYLSGASRATGSTMTPGASRTGGNQLTHIPRGSEPGSYLHSDISRNSDFPGSDVRSPYLLQDGEVMKSFASVERTVKEDGEEIIHRRLIEVTLEP